MATTYSDLATAQYAADGNASQRLENSQLSAGNLYLAEARLTCADIAAANDIVELVYLPEGARVIPHLCKITADNPGTELTVQIGDGANPDLYSGTVDISAGGVFDFAGGDAAVDGYVTTAHDSVDLKAIAVDTLTDASDITVFIAYTLKN